MNAAISAHCREIDRCNQRGGRMLSIFDLMEAGTLDLGLAAFLMARIARGASFMVGAQPGGAGKTTVMCALLNLIPPECRIAAATAEEVHDAAQRPGAGPFCYVCHEIGSGPWFAYLWGRDLRAYCGLSTQGHTLATNLHADNLEEAHAQVCGENGVPEPLFNAFDLLLFLQVRGAWPRTEREVELVYASDGTSPHTKLLDRSAGLCRLDEAPPMPGVDKGFEQACRAFLEEHFDRGVRTIEDTRHAVTAFLTSP